jgi:PAS domain S-box-containing protein
MDTAMNYPQVSHFDNYPLQPERDFLANILDSMDVLVVILDRNGSLIRFNQACERLFGYTTEEIRSNLVTGILPLPGGSLGAIKQILNVIRYSNSTEMHETEWSTKDGQSRTITWSVKSIVGFTGAIEYIFATGTDITNLRTAEKKLQQEQLLLHSLINSIPDLVFYKDTDGVYLGCNFAFEEFSGHFIQGGASRHTDSDFYPSDVAEEFAETDRQVLASKETLRYENQITHSDGREIILETRKSPYYGPDNELIGVIGISRDITKEKKGEDALRKANAEIAQLIASLSSILIVFSPDICVVHWNPSAQKILGISQDEAIGIRLDELKIQWDYSLIAQSIERCLQEGQPQYLDPVRFERTDGNEGYLGINISPIYENENQLSGYILLGGDITERKALENQLAQAQKLRSIGQLAAGIAHEINTPIQYIGDNTSFLKQSLADLTTILAKYDRLLENVRKEGVEGVYAHQIKEIDATKQQIDLDFLRNEIPVAIEQSLDGIQRVTEIVRAMKDFSHPGVVEKVAMDVNKAIENTLTVARNEWKYVADIQTDFTPELPKIFCLPGEINQALLNIIVNAAQAIEEKVRSQPGEKGLITIKTYRKDDWVEILIRDTGLGVPESVRPHIYEPFYTTKEVGKGTGQGLAIAYNIIEIKHGGSLTFKTQLGKGTIFIIRLPINPLENGRRLTPMDA